MGKNNSQELDVEKIIWVVQNTNPYIYRSTCLTNALTAQVLLSQNGYPSLLKIGVMKEAEFEAHAWLEMDGVVVLGDSEREYVPLVDF